MNLERKEPRRASRNIVPPEQDVGQLPQIKQKSTVRLEEGCVVRRKTGKSASIRGQRTSGIKADSSLHSSSKALVIQEKRKQPSNLALNNEPISNQIKDDQKVSMFFRYYPIQILSCCGEREGFLRSLTQTRDFAVMATSKKPPKADLSGFWVKLIKTAALKGKYKYRERFNFAHSAQLKALQFKPKEGKKRKDSSSSEEDDDVPHKERCRDIQAWKKNNGVSGAKVFIVKGTYRDLRNALEERGWVENEDKHSTFFDLKWTTKVSDVNFDSLRPNQMVNHFDNNACLTSKYGLCKSLRSIMYTSCLDVDRFFPKAYDLCDLSDFQNFLEVYKWIYCETLLKKFVALPNIDNLPKAQLLRVKVAAAVIRRRLAPFQRVLKSITDSNYPLCNLNEWNCLQEKSFNVQHINQSIDDCGTNFQDPNHLRTVAEQLLKQLRLHQPQYVMNGAENIWIVKPAFLSRGRGIKCFSKLSDILECSVGRQTQYVVQKYIENPLIIEQRKFDIRLWVIVEDYAPPRIWVYGQFYCRFCLQDYDTNKLSNRFSHLTNNSVQKHNSRIGSAEIEASMWTQDQLEKYILNRFGQNSFKPILGKMREIVVATIVSTQDQVASRRNSFELIGYDFMIDDRLNPWLIEVNSSPSMDYSTAVTRRLVKMVLEDTAKVVIDLRGKKTKKKTAGLFKCVYTGETPFEPKWYNLNEPCISNQPINNSHHQPSYSSSPNLDGRTNEPLLAAMTTSTLRSSGMNLKTDPIISDEVRKPRIN